MSPDLTSLTFVALQAMDLAETHVRTHRPGLLIPKGDRDMATDVDLAVERMIREFLAQATSAVGFQGEEEGGENTPTRWVLDPIDGTVNCARGVPLTGISLALVHEQDALLGVITLTVSRTSLLGSRRPRRVAQRPTDHRSAQPRPVRGNRGCRGLRHDTNAVLRARRPAP